MEKRRLPERIRMLLRQSNRTQKQLCELCGITEACLSRYMTGERFPKSDILANIATALNTTTDYLLGQDDTNIPYEQVFAIIQRSKKYLSNGQKKELSDILLGITRRIEKKKENKD